MLVTLIAAVARNGIIGRDGGLPWSLPDDLKRFKELTTGHHILMGRKTQESIGRPLPRRTNLVLSRGSDHCAPGCETFSDLEQALNQAKSAGESEIFVIGGAAIYEIALPRAQRIHLTRVHADVAGDTRFPPLDEAQWEELSRQEHPADENHAQAFAFTVLGRKS